MSEFILFNLFANNNLFGTLHKELGLFTPLFPYLHFPKDNIVRELKSTDIYEQRQEKGAGRNRQEKKF